MALTEHELYARLVARFAPDASLLRAWPLTGGVSARVTALEVAQPDGVTQKFVVRRHGAADLARNPHIAVDEFTLLRLLRAAGYPAPAPVYLDSGSNTTTIAHHAVSHAESPSAAPHENLPEAHTIFPTPCLVVEYIEGGAAPALANEGVELLEPGLLQQMAAQLAALHRLSITPQQLAFLPEQSRKVAALFSAPRASPDDSPDEQYIRTALSEWRPGLSPNPPVLLHGDFWPGNTLWRDGRLVAVVDWEDAARGDPLADLAISRLEILWAHGAGAMRDFTQYYQALNPLDFADLPAWDLCAALRQLCTLSGWGLDPGAEQTIRAGLHEFTAQASAQLPAGASC